MNLLDEIAVHTGIGAYDAMRIIATAPARYKQFTIPKRGGGSRIIAQPSRELKVLQRFLLEKKLDRLPVHRAAAAYVIGRSIRANAEIHCKNPVILKLDFENFFPSIRVRDWKAYVERNVPEWIPDIQLLMNILFWGQGKNMTSPKCLSIGAPTSPIISNLVMFELDETISQEAAKSEVAYSRYADDITLSGSSIDKLIELEKFIRAAIKRCPTPKLKINEAKRGVYTKGHRRMVTGLILTPKGEVSIGRDRKRQISALLHRFSIEQLSIDQIGYLKGMLGFSIANEPQFVSRLRLKYGNDILDRVLSIELPSRGL